MSDFYVSLEIQLWRIIAIICSRSWCFLSIKFICYFKRRVDLFLSAPSLNVWVSVTTVSHTGLSVPVMLCAVWRHEHAILLLPASTVDTWQCCRLEGLASFTFVPVGSSFKPSCYILPPLACHQFVQYYIGTGCSSRYRVFQEPVIRQYSYSPTFISSKLSPIQYAFLQQVTRISRAIILCLTPHCWPRATIQTFNSWHAYFQ